MYFENKKLAEPASVPKICSEILHDFPKSRKLGAKGSNRNHSKACATWAPLTAWWAGARWVDLIAL